MKCEAVGSAMSSGALAGLASVLSLQPLDVIKTRLQEMPATTAPWYSRISPVIRTTYQNHGLSGFWRGTSIKFFTKCNKFNFLAPTLMRNVPGVAVYFSVLQQIQYLVYVGHQRNWYLADALYDERQKKLSGKGNLVAGALARTFAGTLLMPATVLKVRFESSQYQYGSLPQAIKTIFKTDGFSGFFRGIGATALRDAPHAGLYLFFYEHLKPIIVPDSPVGKLMSGACSGFMATCITQPFDLVKTRIQLAKEPMNFVQTLMGVVKGEGFLALFNGIGPRILRKSLSSAITWTVYEELVTFRRRSNNSDSDS